MKKDYKEWHSKKTKIEHSDGIRLFFHEREVWWCSLGYNVGFEQDGKGEKYARPVLVFKKFNKEVFWALPLSMRVKKNKFYAPVKLDDDIERVVIISQLRLIDAKRLIDKIGVVSKENYKEIQKAIVNLAS